MHPTLAQLATPQLPRPAAPWPEQGGIFAGLLTDAGLNTPVTALIVHPDDLAGSHEWGPYGTDVAGAKSYYDGFANTNAMAEAGSQVAQAVRALRTGGFEDWHIPSQAESHLMAATVKHLRLAKWYWTSTQDGRNNAWIQSFGCGTQDGIRKGSHYLVRPVRRFILPSFSPLQTPAQATETAEHASAE